LERTRERPRLAEQAVHLCVCVCVCV
jgi:hypothetical protein